MSLIAIEMNELRELLENFKSGGITPQAVRTQLGIYKESHKRTRLYVDLYIASGNKVNAKAFETLISKEDATLLLPTAN